MKNLPIQIKFLIGIIIVSLIFGTLSSIFNCGVELYNKSKELSLSYNKIVQEQISNYDGYYLTFIDKQTNANINKETFVNVTNIIMSNRKDGEHVSWKWVQENQQIPYEEFTIFYKELSQFISERYQDNMRIEREKQNIVNQQNLLLSLFPNNVVNHFLNIPNLQYKAGYISDITKSKFK